MSRPPRVSEPMALVPATLLEEPADDRTTLWLTIAEDGEARVLPLASRGRLVIGRGPGCDVVLRNPLASREHAELVIGDRIELQDCASANGTFVDGQRLPRGSSAELRPGTTARVGAASLVVQELRGAGSARARCHDATTLVARIDATSAAFVALVKARAVNGLEARWTSLAIAQLLAPDDAFLWLDERAVVLALPRATEAQARAEATKLVARLRSSRLVDAADVSVVAALTSRQWRDDIVGAPSPATSNGVVVRDAAMVRLYELVDRLAAGAISVLLLGETGVGKDVVADALHARSPRRGGPYVRINCAAMPEALLESELFGHETGAFTGAKATKPGLLEAAGGGTVFLDEVGELPLGVQAKLLRALEAKEITRVGGLAPRAIDVRFVSATNRDLQALVREGTFREDLFFRLGAAVLRVPPLRARRGEIRELARVFTERAAAQIARAAPTLTEEALTYLERQDWPGNVRQLKNAIERAVLMTVDDELGVDDLTIADAAEEPTTARVVEAGSSDASDERSRIEAALRECVGNQTRAAAKLGIARRTLVKKLSQYGMPRPRKS